MPGGRGFKYSHNNSLYSLISDQIINEEKNVE